MQVLKFFAHIFIFLCLTILTQIGGIVYVIAIFSYRFIEKRLNLSTLKKVSKIAYFLGLYLLSTAFIVPILAKPLGRVPLPWTETHHLKPLNLITCLLNRNYVRPALRQSLFEVAEEMNTRYPNTTIQYLDANFPFINRFPLLPHLSHNDGKKLDLSFCYIDNATQLPCNESPSWIGYGICEEPYPNEKNTTDFCKTKGYWQYDFLRKIVPQNAKNDFSFDAKRTQTLVQLLAKQPAISKIFIEPHLVTRLQLNSPKIRFHGCQAVRHDDHIHVQL